jgi:aerobic carbon-monoxide dehydrogenase medium subunit
VAAADFFVGDRQTVLETGEIVTAATFTVPRRAAYVKFLNPAARYAMVGVFAAVAEDGSPRLAITGARVGGASRWREAEQSLRSEFIADALHGVHPLDDALVEDLFADAEYRSHLTRVLARRAVALAAGSVPAVVVLSHGSRVGTGV